VLSLTQRPLRRATALFAALIAAAALAAVLAPAAAQAANRCATDGHAYITRPGGFFFSGFNGDQRFGIPTTTVSTEQSLKLGGNGILPGSRITFQAWNRANGTVLEFTRGRGLAYSTNGARSNCVVNEESFRLSLPPGEYRIQAIYNPGNQPWMSVVDQVVNLNVVSPAPVGGPTPNPDVGWAPIGY
jgi:hypothetical protein